MTLECWSFFPDRKRREGTSERYNLPRDIRDILRAIRELFHVQGVEGFTLVSRMCIVEEVDFILRLFIHGSIGHRYCGRNSVLGPFDISIDNAGKLFTILQIELQLAEDSFDHFKNIDH